MTDPRSERRAQRRASIVATAWELARRDGLAGLTLHDLARAVGLRQPSLYVYFDSKLALYDALFADGYRQLLEFSRSRDHDGEPRDLLVRFLRDHVEWAGADPVRYQMLFQRPVPGFEPSPESWALALDFYALATGVLAEAGLTDQASVDLFSALVSGMSSQQVANDPGGTRWADHSELAVDLLLRTAERPSAARPKARPTGRPTRRTT